MMCLSFVGESHFSASTGHYFSDGLITQKMYFSQAIHRLVDENVQCDPIRFAAFLPSGHHSLSEFELSIALELTEATLVGLTHDPLGFFDFLKVMKVIIVCTIFKVMRNLQAR